MSLYDSQLFTPPLSYSLLIKNLCLAYPGFWLNRCQFSFKITRLSLTEGSRQAFKNNLMPPENLVSGDLRWFSFSPCRSDTEVYPRVCQYTVTSLLGLATGATWHDRNLLGGIRPVWQCTCQKWNMLKRPLIQKVTVHIPYTVTATAMVWLHIPLSPCFLFPYSLSDNCQIKRQKCHKQNHLLKKKTEMEQAWNFHPEKAVKHCF